MIDLEKHYGSIKADELVKIVESIDCYEPEVIIFCKEQIKKKKVSKELLKDYSSQALRKRFYLYFANGKYLSNESIITRSHFLEADEIKTCFEKSKLEYIKHIEAMTISVSVI